MANLKKLPFRENFADFIFCLGVLHHLPTPALDEVRALRRFAPRFLIYLYYALDNRPWYFRVLLTFATGLRRTVAPIQSRLFRSLLTWMIAVLIYSPLITIGYLLRPFGLACSVPLYETYAGKSLTRIRQDVYDRFFTTIEQRCSRQHILSLVDTFSKVVISDRNPYWHFLCER
jgi:hypothetical protein